MSARYSLVQRSADSSQTKLPGMVLERFSPVARREPGIIEFDRRGTRPDPPYSAKSFGQVCLCDAQMTLAAE